MDVKIYIPHFDAFPLAEIPLNWCKPDEPITTSRFLHWDTINVGLTLGLRTGAKALQVLGINRGRQLEQKWWVGISLPRGLKDYWLQPYRGTMILDGANAPMGEWKLRLIGPDNAVEIRLYERMYWRPVKFWGWKRRPYLPRYKSCRVQNFCRVINGLV